MTKTKENEKKADHEKEYLGKKSLKDILSSYLEKKQNENSVKKIKKDFSELKLNLKKSRTSYETLIEIQEKLNSAYNNIADKNGHKETQKDN